ncbi:hypothetical protein B0H65DRAFT_544713 [Neurospora tetraspora]|uniref:Uncharacterized protein n=1 Tax=Neurospora tetraspora TaxID=94610 RepID=A0AAE0JR43_9PEZI|nr:hypothetical protein B0H65DRAFT_544713 [Neurospora tetraspora]
MISIGGILHLHAPLPLAAYSPGTGYPQEAKLKKHEGALEGRFRPAPSTGIVTTVRRWTVGLSTPWVQISPLTLEGATPTIGPRGEIQPMESFRCSAPERLLLGTKGTIPAHAAARLISDDDDNNDDNDDDNDNDDDDNDDNDDAPLARPRSQQIMRKESGGE